MKKKQKPPFPLRLDDETKLKVQMAARLDRRSINTWLQLAAEEKLDRDKERVAA
jgi:hypothetical protein